MLGNQWLFLLKNSVLGFILNSNDMTIRLPDQKIEEESFWGAMCYRLKTGNKDTSTNFGHIVSCFLGIQYGYLHYRYLEANKVDVLKEIKNIFISCCSC